MDKARLQYLFERYFTKTATVEERDELSLLMDDAGNKEYLQQLFSSSWDAFNGTTSAEVFTYSEADVILEKILGNKEEGKLVELKPKERRTGWRWIAAASIILVTGYVLWVTSIRKPQVGEKTEVAKTNDVEAPKETRAVIVLADGSKVYLDSVNNGTVAQQGSTNVIKTADGKIIYSPLTTDHSQITYNTLTNPRGSKVIDMQLSDGSHVWLNAGSSVKYPVAFVGNERVVEITGEAYFEVAHDASKPFHVKKGETDITVLGTHFNVNAYDDEDALRVTLLEGSVRVTQLSPAGGGDLRNSPNYKRPGVDNSVVIKPGQQAVVTHNSPLTTHNDVDLDQVMAWKNGLFSFEKTDIGKIMNDIARWYDVQVEYEGAKPQLTLSGTVKRNLNVSKVLQMLELSGLKFRIEGKKIIVLK